MNIINLYPELLLYIASLLEPQFSFIFLFRTSKFITNKLQLNNIVITKQLYNKYVELEFIGNVGRCKHKLSNGRRCKNGIVYVTPNTILNYKLWSKYCGSHTLCRLKEAVIGNSALTITHNYLEYQDVMTEDGKDGPSVFILSKHYFLHE